MPSKSLNDLQEIREKLAQKRREEIGRISSAEDALTHLPNIQLALMALDVAISENSENKDREYQMFVF